MPRHQEVKQLPYSTEFLYGLVKDVESYPQFLPWCLGATIVSKKETSFIADLDVGYKFFKETFRSEVHFQDCNLIEIQYLKGPFKSLYNSWKFQEINSQECLLDFQVDFTFKSGLFENMIQAFFAEAIKQMMQAFEARAASLSKTA